MDFISMASTGPQNFKCKLLVPTTSKWTEVGGSGGSVMD